MANTQSQVRTVWAIQDFIKAALSRLDKSLHFGVLDWIHSDLGGELGGAQLDASGWQSTDSVDMEVNAIINVIIERCGRMKPSLCAPVFERVKNILVNEWVVGPNGLEVSPAIREALEKVNVELASKIIDDLSQPGFSKVQ
jgi:hypothetical protein